MNTPFTELPMPKQTKELTVVARWIEAGEEDSLCMHMIGNGLCRLRASWNCQVCGQWTCDLHESQNQGFEGSAICEDCGKLSREDRERVCNFRKEMNSL